MNNKIIPIVVAIVVTTLAATTLYADVDLRINSAHFEDTDDIASLGALLRFSVSNLSGDGVEYVRVNFHYLTQQGNLGSAVGGTHVIDLSSYSTLRSGETATYSFYVTFSSTGASGDYWLHLEIEPPTEAGVDPDTSNNTIFTDNSVHYTALRTDRADVVVLYCGFNTNLKERNRPITGAVEYLNNSTVAAQNVVIRFYLSTDAVINESDTLLATFNKGTLDHHFYQKQTLEVPLDPDLPTGYYYGGVIISSSNDVDISNNTGVSSKIQIGDPGAFTSGGIRISFFPEVVQPLAGWRRVGTEKWFTHGEVEADLPPDPYVIEFRDVEGYKTPKNLTVVVTLGNIASRGVTYAGPPANHNPVIEEFRIVPSEVYYTDPAWLIWKVKNAYGVSIQPKGGWHGGLIGTDIVRMKESATFTLTAKNWVPDKWGSDIRYESSSKVRLKVKRDPEIKLFTSNSSLEAPLHTSEPVKLYWSTGGAIRLLFDIDSDGSSDLMSRQTDGVKEFHMDASGSVRLTAQGKKKQKDVSESIPIYVTELPVVRSFTLSPRAAVAGEEVTLSWNAPGLESGALEPLGLSITETRGEYRFTASESMDLKLRATNGFSETEAVQRLDVSATGTDLSLEHKSSLTEGGKRNPIRIEGGSEYTTYVTLTNSGEAKAKGFLVALYADGQLVDQERINVELGQGQYEGVQLSYTPVTSRKVELQIVVDPEGTVPDKNRDNNVSSFYILATKPQKARVAIGNIQLKQVGQADKDNTLMLSFDVAQFGGIGKTAYYYEVLVYDVDNHGRENEVARLEGFLNSNLSNKRLERVMRLLRLEGDSMDGRIKISVMNLKNSNGFIDLNSSNSLFIREVLVFENQ